MLVTAVPVQLKCVLAHYVPLGHRGSRGLRHIGLLELKESNTHEPGVPTKMSEPVSTQREANVP